MKTKLKGIATDNDDDDVDAIITTTHTSGAQTNTLHQTDNLTSSSSAAAAFEYRHPALDVYHLLPLENKTTSFISQPYVWVIMSLSLVVLGLLKYHEIDVSQMNIIDITKNIGKCLCSNVNNSNDDDHYDDDDDDNYDDDDDDHYDYDDGDGDDVDDYNDDNNYMMML